MKVSLPVRVIVSQKNLSIEIWLPEEFTSIDEWLNLRVLGSRCLFSHLSSDERNALEVLERT